MHFKKGNKFLRTGNHERALEEYRKGAKKSPELKKFFDFQINRLIKNANYPKDSIENLIETGHQSSHSNINHSYSPALVTVLMTAHNVEEYIEESIFSILNQTYNKIELIIVDDASTDQTGAKIIKIAEKHEAVKYKRLNCNLGTYFAKNYGLTISNGEYIFFQDGDDICHPKRIEEGVSILRSNDIVCYRGSYSRVLFPEGRVIPVNGEIQRKGLITLGIKRNVFNEIGFFNCTTKASDDEYFQRICKFYGKEKIYESKSPLYFNTLRENSLFADMISNQDYKSNERGIIQKPSKSRAEYVSKFQKVINNCETKESIKKIYTFPIIRPPYELSDDMLKLAKPDLPVIGLVFAGTDSCTDSFLRNIKGQVDYLYIFYSNKGSLFIDYNDNNHTPLQNTKKTNKEVFDKILNSKSYIFFFNTTIDLPPDFTSSILEKIVLYRGHAVIGITGALITKNKTYEIARYPNEAIDNDKITNSLYPDSLAFKAHGSNSPLAYRLFNSWIKMDNHAYIAKQDDFLIIASRHQNWLPKGDNNEEIKFEEELLDSARKHSTFFGINEKIKTYFRDDKSLCDQVSQKLIPTLYKIYEH